MKWIKYIQYLFVAISVATLAYLVFSMTQGMRRGELCGLKWKDIDWKKKQGRKVQRWTTICLVFWH